MPNPVESLAVKTAAKASALAARAKGLSGVFNTLAEQHEQAALLLRRAEGSEDLAQRQELWATIRRELLAHERAEVSAIYPVLEQHAATLELAQQHNDDVPTLEASIAELDVAGCDCSDWKPLIQRLAMLVQQHADEEENIFFPRAIEALGKQAAHDLEAPFAAARSRALEELASETLLELA